MEWQQDNVILWQYHSMTNQELIDIVSLSQSFPKGN
jgi:hypothetical protein